MKQSVTKKRIYIAGPMRGYSDLNYSAFNHAMESILSDPKLNKVWCVLNPVLIGKDFSPVPIDFIRSPQLLARLMEFELAVVKSCDAIYLLRGWERSEGALAELRVALDNKLEIYTEESGRLIR